MVVPHGASTKHKVGFWLASVVDNKMFDGDLGRGTGSLFERELYFAWFLWGIALSGVLAPLMVAL